MTWPSATVFRARAENGADGDRASALAWKTSAVRALLLLWVSIRAAAPATVSGRVILIADPAHQQSMAEGSSTVVWLAPVASTVPAHGAGHARMVQKNKHFEPHILPIQVGTTVDFPNLDPIFHNAFSNFNGQLFDIGLYPPESSRSILFRREGLVRVFCNIHPSMSAVIVVVATPFFTLTDAQGRYSMLNVPAGEYRLHFFQERTIPETLDALTKTVVVTDQGTDLGEVKISEAGYIPTPHKNKYGRDYPPEKSDIYH